MCTDNNIEVDIKTNAAWARTSFGAEIFKDLVDIIHEKPMSYQISLSLDNYHKNSVDNAVRVISTMAGEKCRIPISLSRFENDGDLYAELKRRLRQAGMPIQPMQILQQNGNMFDVDVVGDGVILDVRAPVVPFANGRAVNLAEATPTKFPQFCFVLPGRRGTVALMAFDVFENVTLGENSGRKIHTSWIQRRNYVKPLDKIKRDLIRNARYEEIRAMVCEKWKPIHLVKKSR